MTTASDFIAALKRNDRAGAVSTANRLIAQDAALGNQWSAVARFAVRVAEWPTAIAAMRKYVAQAPNDIDRVLQFADVLAGAGQLDASVALITPLSQRMPDDARLRHLLGTAHIQLGDLPLGVQHLEAAARLWPASGMTWLALATTRTATSDGSAFAALLAAEGATRNAVPAARAAYLYALGKAWDDLGEIDAAFAAFSDGAMMIRPDRPYDCASDRAAAVAIVEQFDANWLDRAAMPSAGPTGPIFVTGLPRSGTTLVDQILSSHSSIAGGGELNLMEIATSDNGGTAPMIVRRRFDQSNNASDAWGAVGPLYRHLLSQRWPGAARAIDKSLNTSRFAAHIRLGMPDARVIWLRRDPLDTAWSCFRTFFSQGLGWTFDLNDIAWHFAIEDLLFEHWRVALGPRMLVVPYAALVADLRNWLPRIAAHVGLAFEPAMLAFDTNRRAVSTASVTQVRQPVHQRAVGSALPYARHLSGFVEAYTEARLGLGLGLPA